LGSAICYKEKGEKCMISKLKQFKYNQILSLIRKEHSISRVAIAKQTGHSKPTVSKVINHLIDKGVVKEIGMGKGNINGGRKPIIVSFNENYRNVISVDIGGTKTIVALLNLDGKILYSETFSSEVFQNKDTLIKILSEKITEFVQHAGKTPLLGISIGVPGVVDKKKGMISYMPSFDISNLNLESVLKDKFKLPVYLENDVTLSAYGEIWIGNGKQYNTILLVSIGTGIGGGIVIDNKVHTGLGGNAGEICDMVTDWTQERDKKSGFGRLEEWVGGHALEQFISEKKIGKDLRYFANIDKKNEEFDNFLFKGATHLGLAISNAILLLDPDKVILAGGVGYNFYEKMYPTIIKTLQHVLPHSFYREDLIEKSLLEPFGCVIGGCNAIQKENLINSIFKL
jgi:predicted NBD/HSP70 family sugar kinase